MKYGDRASKIEVIKKIQVEKFKWNMIIEKAK